MPLQDPNSRTHHGCEESLSIHSQHWPEVPKGGQGLSHQREVEAKDNRSYWVLYTILRDSRGLGVCLLSFPSPLNAWRSQKCGYPLLTGNCSFKVSHFWFSPKLCVCLYVLFFVSSKMARECWRLGSRARSYVTMLWISPEGAGHHTCEDFGFGVRQTSVWGSAPLLPSCMTSGVI